MTSKGNYSYEYIDNYSKLYETQLPLHKLFIQAQNILIVTIWDTFN